MRQKSSSNNSAQRGRTSTQMRGVTTGQLRAVRGPGRDENRRTPRSHTPRSDMSTYGIIGLVALIVLGVVFYMTRGTSNQFQITGDTDEEIRDKNIKTRELNEKILREAQQAAKNAPAPAAPKVPATPAPDYAAPTPPPAPAPAPAKARDGIPSDMRPGGGIVSGFTVDPAPLPPPSKPAETPKPPDAAAPAAGDAAKPADGAAPPADGAKPTDPATK